jgi:DNA-binding XRE family transcriptional regulator
MTDAQLFIAACGPGNTPGRLLGAGLTTRDPGACWSAGPQIKQQRKRLRLTQENLGHRAGLNKRLVWEVETGRAGLTPAGLAALAEALEVSVAWLSGTED